MAYYRQEGDIPPKRHTQYRRPDGGCTTTVLTQSGERLGEAARLAFRDTVPVAMGYIPLGVAYGLLLVSSGLDWYWAPLSSLIVFAGAMQFLSVPLLMSGVPVLEFFTTALVINFRHAFYGLSFPLGKLGSPIRQAYKVFALTDETYSLVAAKGKDGFSGPRITFIQLFSHAWWIGGSAAGALASMALPSSVTGVDFALTGLFVVLAQEHAYKRDNRSSMLLGLVAGAVGLIAGNNRFLSVAMGSLVVMVAAAAWREHKQQQTKEHGESGKDQERT